MARLSDERRSTAAQVSNGDAQIGLGCELVMLPNLVCGFAGWIGVDCLGSVICHG